jgi:hypothetical protein
MSKDEEDYPLCFQKIVDDDGNEKYLDLSDHELSLIERFWVCQQIRNDKISKEDIALRYNIDISLISKWLLNLVPTNHTVNVESPIDELGMDILMIEYNKDLEGDDDKRYSKTIMEQQQYTIERKTLHDMYY